jgi:glutamate synthase (NADPH/NADH) small chain
VFERDDAVGGLLRYGIPDFKLGKDIVDRRIKIWEEEGIVFKTGMNVGVDYPADRLLNEFEAVCLAGGSRVPRDLAVEGRDLEGIYFALDYLTQSNRRIGGEKIPEDKLINARDKRVVVIGGGDTGSDCVGTAHRQGAKSVAQIEIMPRPAEHRTADYPWPKYPLVLKTTSSHQEGGERQWSVMTKRFIGDRGHVNKLHCEKSGGSGFEIEADLVVLALGFLHPEHQGLVSELQLKLDERGNIHTDANYMTSRQKVFAAGDMRRGQSLVVWAISEGRRAAYSIDKYLMGKSSLPVL